MTTIEEQLDILCLPASAPITNSIAIAIAAEVAAAAAAVHLSMLAPSFLPSSPPSPHSTFIYTAGARGSFALLMTTTTGRGRRRILP